jgi:hypothetical protein
LFLALSSDPFYCFQQAEAASGRRMKTFLLVFFLMAATASARRDRNDQRGEEDPSHQVRRLIVNGRDAPPGKYPYFTQATSYIRCGAALIAPDILITADHCGRGWTKGASVNSTLYYKFDDDDVGAIHVKVEKILRHKNHNWFTEANDLMMIKISPPVTSVTPITVNKDGKFPSRGKKLITMGFGDMSDKSDDIPLRLQHAIVEERSCKPFFQPPLNYPKMNTDKLLCGYSRTPYRNTCFGEIDLACIISIFFISTPLFNS